MSGEPNALDPTVDGSDPRASHEGGHDRGVAIGGLVLGRYRIVRRLGAGGMGVVYEARDTELERRIALKVMRHPARGDSDEAIAQRARLVREAQAMAQVSHAHVVSVYDAATSGDDVYIAMELVEGDSLGSWLAAARRGWREIVDVFVQAGRGLAAAHAAGLVHRDFKPSNVLVGTDGRVRVCDFGLARVSGARHDAGGESTALDVALTREGALLGTPMYMPPEQFASHEVDARGDQYSVCASLWEAFAGGPPYAGDTPEQLLDAVRNVKLRPIEARIPRRLRRVMLRGLSVDPQRRFESVDALVAELEAIRRRPRRIAAVAGAAVLVVATASIALIANRHDTAPSCESGAQLAGTWDVVVRTRVAAAFASSSWSGAAATFKDTAHRLDAYAEQWTAMRTQACTAMRSDTQSAELFDLRIACLERRRAALGALTELLAHADEALVLKAVPAVIDLPPIDCDDVTALRRAIPLPGDPALRVEIDRLRAAADRAAALRRAGKYAAGLAIARPLATGLDKVRYAPVQAEVLIVLAELEDYGGDAQAAEAAYRSAANAAGDANDDRLLASAWASLVYVVGLSEGRLDEAIQIGDFAGSVVARAKNGAISGTLHNNLGAVNQLRGALDDAAREFTQAIELREAAYGIDHPAVASSTANLGAVRTSQRQYAEAQRLLQRALDIKRRVLGPDHPEVAQALSALAIVTSNKDPRAAIDLERQALALRKAAHVPGFEIATSLSNLAGYEVMLEQFTDAERDSREAVALLRDTLPAKHPNLGIALTSLAEALDKLNRPREAIPIGEEALAIAEANLGNAVALADARGALGIALYESGTDRKRGRDLVIAARDGYKATGHDGWERASNEWLSRATAP